MLNPFGRINSILYMGHNKVLVHFKQISTSLNLIRLKLISAAGREWRLASAVVFRAE